MASVAYGRTFWRLLGFLRPYKVSLIISVVLAAASQGVAIALLVITGRVIDDALRPRDTTALWTFIGLIVGLGVVKALCMFGRRVISGKQALGVEFDIRNGL